MTSFNLSEWAIRHRSLVTYFMLLITVAGIVSYLQLGRSEDPDFTVKTMVVSAAWPGATVEDTLEQITDRIESKLQDTPSLDYLKSYTIAGRATIFVTLQDSTTPTEVPDIWYQVRKKVGDIRNTLPQGIVGPTFDDDRQITPQFENGAVSDRCGAQVVLKVETANPIRSFKGRGAD